MIIRWGVKTAVSTWYVFNSMLIKFISSDKIIFLLQLWACVHEKVWNFNSFLLIYTFIVKKVSFIIQLNNHMKCTVLSNVAINCKELLNRLIKERRSRAILCVNSGRWHVKMHESYSLFNTDTTTTTTYFFEFHT